MENGGVVVCSRRDPVRANVRSGVSRARGKEGAHGVGTYIGASVGGDERVLTRHINVSRKISARNIADIRKAIGPSGIGVGQGNLRSVGLVIIGGKDICVGAEKVDEGGKTSHDIGGIGVGGKLHDENATVGRIIPVGGPAIGEDGGRGGVGISFQAVASEVSGLGSKVVSDPLSRGNLSREDQSEKSGGHFRGGRDDDLLHG